MNSYLIKIIQPLEHGVLRKVGSKTTRLELSLNSQLI